MLFQTFENLYLRIICIQRTSPIWTLDVYVDEYKFYFSFRFDHNNLYSDRNNIWQTWTQQSKIKDLFPNAFVTTSDENANSTKSSLCPILKSETITYRIINKNIMEY